MRAIIIVLIPTISHSSLTSLGLELHEMKKKKILLEEKSNPGKEEGKKGGDEEKVFLTKYVIY